MGTISASATVGALVTEQPNRSRLFEELGIDYCCGGKKTLSQVCGEMDLDLDEIKGRLEAVAPPSPENGSEDCAAMALSDLVEHILATHHTYLKRELPRLAQMTRKVADVHGDNDARLHDVAKVFGGLVDELGSHMMKEEHILFPLICKLDQGGAASPLPFGALASPIRVMEAEHDSAGKALARLRELTEGFAPPDWACNTYRALLDGLAELERDTHQHIHKENNILFPRALELEGAPA